MQVLPAVQAPSEPLVRVGIRSNPVVRASRGQREDFRIGQAKRRHPKVLLVGSLRELALYRAEVLSWSGYEVTPAFGAAEARSLLERIVPDVAVLTYTLPTHEVEEVAELIRQTKPDCPLIAISRTRMSDRKIHPDAVVLADRGPEALLRALGKFFPNRIQ